ncbi:MAG: F0F1 ATP synthase subunit gamma [Gammaproteobacteria bacterium]
MSRSRKLQLHKAQFEEMRAILNSMKNLAFIEAHKLDRYLSAQGRVVAYIEYAAIDFLTFYRYLPETDESTYRICVLIGSERGFCGDFNERLVDAAFAGVYHAIIAIGSRLSAQIENNALANVAETMPGANIAEEVPGILDRLVGSIGLLQKNHGYVTLTVIHHDDRVDRIVQRQVLPPSLPQEGPVRDRDKGNPPVLNIEPADFFSELIDQYLFAVLHEILYRSLMAENQRRQRHLEGAVQHLDDEIIRLDRKSQVYRQEEITEEIEVILLNSENH